MSRKKKNLEFKVSAFLNDETLNDYLYRMKRIALSMFKWENLPSSMDERFLEQCLFFNGQASFLYDEDYGYINTQCSSSGDLNIYHLPTKLNCYSFTYQKTRDVYFGFKNSDLNKDQCILVMNNYDRYPTATAIELFAYRLYNAERTIDVNITAQKTPCMIITDEKQRLLMENLYAQYSGNKPFIFGDKNQLSEGMIRAIDTKAPYVADKLSDYKKEIWNEFLMYMGINSLLVDKKERLVSDEANSNNEVTNYNLQSFLLPRQKACQQFNELFGLKGTDKEISVKLNSDLHNILKQEMSSIKNNEVKQNG